MPSASASLSLKHLEHTAVMNNEAIYTHTPTTRKKLTEVLTKAELQDLTGRSNLAGFWAVFSTWAVIAATLAFAAWSTALPPIGTVLAWILAIVVLGGRQLALAIASHEGAHRTLFSTRALNDHFTDWLCARPIGLDLFKYREHHFIHHTKTGTDEDVDISLIKGLPTTRPSLRRKMMRDLLGLTGMKFLFGRLVMDAEYMKWTVASDYEWLPRKSAIHHILCFIKNFYPTLLTNLALFAALQVAGHGEVYLVWLIAYITTYPLFIRIRSLAEHAATERTTDMFKNTRTTRAGWLARTLVAPLNVNYHIEHHAMASVPWHKLPKLHRILLARGLVQNPPGYLEVLKLVSSAPVNQRINQEGI